MEEQLASIDEVDHNSYKLSAEEKEKILNGPSIVQRKRDLETQKAKLQQIIVGFTDLERKRKDQRRNSPGNTVCFFSAGTFPSRNV